MKTLCMTYEYPPIGGGGARVAHPLATSLLDHGHSIDVVTSGMTGLPPFESVDDIDVHRVWCVRRHRHYTSTPELLTYLRPAYLKALELWQRKKFDINHTHFALPTGLVSYYLYKKTGLPYVTTIHGSDVPGYNMDRFRAAHVLVRPVWKRIIRSSSMVISASHYLKDLIQSHIDVPVEVSRNGFDPQFERGTDVKKEKRILVVTRMFRRKGVQHFIEALQGLNHDWDVVVAGDGPYLPRLKDQVKRNGLNVRFTGFVQGDELVNLYRSSSIFVFPSMQENFPTVLLEAMQAGCAVITTNTDGCGEVIGDAGIVVSPEKPDQIRNALNALIRDPAKIQRFRELSANRLKLFRWPRISQQYDEFLRSAAGTRSEMPRDRSSAASIQPE